MDSPGKYRHAPLEYVILQVAHPAAPALTPGEVAALKQALVTKLPLVTTDTINHLEFDLGPGGAPPKTHMKTEPVVRFSARDRRTVATFSTQAITLETTNYDTWGLWRQLAEQVLVARMDVAPVDGVERIGVRYIDEIRLPMTSAVDWSTWINPRLAPPVLDEVGEGLRVGQQQATIQYETYTPDVLVTLRYGALNGPSAVGDIPVVRPHIPLPGPFFLIDTDAAWAPSPGAEVPVLRPADVLNRADTLHDFVKRLFEASLTDKLRMEVLNAESD